jgi:hypothetical protein
MPLLLDELAQRPTHCLVQLVMLAVFTNRLDHPRRQSVDNRFAVYTPQLPEHSLGGMRRGFPAAE